MTTLFKTLILFATTYLVGCVDQSHNTSYGSYLSLRNNTFGYNDFRVSDSGSFAISYGAIDFGRNLYRDSNNQHDYHDSIGYIYLNGQGSGHIEFVNQDSLYHLIGFSYTKNKTKTNSLSLNLCNSSIITTLLFPPSFVPTSAESGLYDFSFTIIAFW